MKLLLQVKNDDGDSINISRKRQVKKDKLGGSTMWSQKPVISNVKTMVVMR